MAKKGKILTLSILALMGGITLGMSNNANVNNSSTFVKQASIKKAYDFNDKKDEYLDEMDGAHEANRAIDGDTVLQDYAYISANTTDVTVKDDDKSLYKAGIKNPDSFNKGTLRLKIRVTGELDYTGLVFRVYGNDTRTPIDKNFSDLKNDEGIANALKKDSWVNFDINFNESYETTDTYEGGNGIGVLSTEGVRRFHILNGKDSNSGTIEIQLIETIVGSTETIFDNFRRLSKGTAADTQYWTDSTGDLIPANVLVKNGSYLYKRNSKIEYKNIGLVAKGATTDAKFKFVKDATGTLDETEYSYSDLKDNEGNALSALGSTYSNIMINPKNTGFAGDVYGISVSTTDSELVISKIFGSDCVTRVAESVFPGLDLENAEMYEDFNFTYAPTTKAWSTNYEGGVTSETNYPELYKRHITAAVNWADSANVLMDGSNLVLPTSAGYSSFYLGTDRSFTQLDYVVMKIKATDCVLNENFRVKLGVNNDLWNHDAYSGYLLKAVDVNDATYPYTTEDGYSYIIYNLEESKMDKTKIDGGITFQWANTVGDIKIDEVFYCNKAQEVLTATNVGESNDVPGGNGYTYGNYVPAGSKYYEVKIKATSDAGYSLKNFRIEFEGLGIRWVDENEQGRLIGEDGNPFEVKTLVKDESVVLKIDLAASGWDMSEGHNVHIHSYQVEDAAIGNITISDRKYYRFADLTNDLLEEPVIASITGDYSGNSVKAEDSNISGAIVGDILRFTFNVASDTTNALGGIRYAIGGSLVWFDHTQANHFVDPQGNAISVDLKKGDNIVDVSLSKSGLNPYAVAKGEIYQHNISYVGDFTLSLKQLSLVRNQADNDFSKVKELDFEPPVITLSASKTAATVGDEITITASATDNATEPSDIEISTKVYFGEEEVTVTDNKFTVTKDGTYTIKITAKDASNNESTKSLNVTVTKKAEVIDNGNTSTQNGLKGWQVALIVVGCFIGVGLIGGLVYFFIKKKK